MRIVNPKAPADLNPVCVRLFVSLKLWERLRDLCTESADPDPRGVPPSMLKACGADGVMVHIAALLQDEQWCEQMSDGTVRAHGFEPLYERMMEPYLRMAAEQDKVDE